MTGMYAEERHEAIAGLVRQHGRVSVSEVASTFGVTTETVRRDLASLERAGLLRRVHGGAVPTSSLALAEQVGNQLTAADVHHTLGLVAEATGDVPEARAQAEAAVAGFERAGLPDAAGPSRALALRCAS